MNEAKYIGMDVHQATISAAVLDSAGNLVMEAIVGRILTKFICWLVDVRFVSYFVLRVYLFKDPTEMRAMRYSKIQDAVILAFCGSLLNCVVHASQTTAPIPWASRAVALSALENKGDAHLASLDPKLGTEGIVVYRVVVNPDGSILRREKINGDPALEALAGPFVIGWHFKGVSISGSQSSWWSYVGVCFFRNADKMVPCGLPQGEPSDKTEDTVPSRLFLVGKAEGNHYDFPPLHKTKGARLQRPDLARVGRITGEVTVDLVIAPDGAVSQATRIVGHPLLLDATVEAVRGWRFEPVTFQGKTVEVQLRFKVQYGPND